MPTRGRFGRSSMWRRRGPRWMHTPTRADGGTFRVAGASVGGDGGTCRRNEAMSWWHKGSALRRRLGAAGAVTGMVALAAACIPIRDSAFGTKGLVRLPETVGQVADTEVQPDGKVVVLASG